MRYILILIAISVGTFAHAQQSELMLKYRQMALSYNQDIKSAQENISASVDAMNIAKADMAPSIGANAAYQYVGNPMELNLNLANSPLSFQGPNNQYGAYVSLSQPIYSGRRLMETLKKAQYQHDYVQSQSQLLQNAVSQQSDMTYWNCVARREMIDVVQSSKESIDQLVSMTRQRVELGYTNPEELLMSEVKSNEIELELQRAQTAYATSILSLNSLIGYDLGNNTEVDSAVMAITSIEPYLSLTSRERPEQVMAQKQISITQADKKIVGSRYMPQLHIGADFNYQSPAYDFSPDLKPNYGIYAKLSIPILQWGKRGKESSMAQSRINIAKHRLRKTEDKISLEIETARLALTRAINQVNLSYSSLGKAFENEKKSMERYGEGQLSITDVLQAQLYRQNAQINYIQAKLNAQNSWSELQYALNLYNR